MGEDERQASTSVEAAPPAEASGDQPEGGAPRDPDEIKRDIEQTRQELGDTVAAVAEKADVKGQAKAKVDEVKERITDKKDDLADRAKQAAPESSGQAAEQAQSFAREHRTELIIAGAVVAGFLIGRLRRG
jgi:ElaB/YqjD/DUF883 family membrane-anchored ribosome-binding protein